MKMILHRTVSITALKGLSDLDVDSLKRVEFEDCQPSQPLTCRVKPNIKHKSNKELNGDIALGVKKRNCAIKKSPFKTKISNFSSQNTHNVDTTNLENMLQSTHPLEFDQVLSPVVPINSKEITTKRQEIIKPQNRNPFKEIYSAYVFPNDCDKLSENTSEVPGNISNILSVLNQNDGMTCKSKLMNSKKSKKSKYGKINKLSLKLKGKGNDLGFRTLQKSFNKPHKNETFTCTEEEVSLLFEFPAKVNVNNIKDSVLNDSAKNNPNVVENTCQILTSSLKRKQTQESLDQMSKKIKNQMCNLDTEISSDTILKVCLNDPKFSLNSDHFDNITTLNKDEVQFLNGSEIHSPVLGGCKSNVLSNSKEDKECLSPTLGCRFTHSENLIGCKHDSNTFALCSDIVLGNSFIQSIPNDYVVNDEGMDQRNEMNGPLENKNKKNLVIQEMSSNQFIDTISFCKQYSGLNELVPTDLNNLVNAVSPHSLKCIQTKNVHSYDSAKDVFNKPIYISIPSNLKSTNLNNINEPLSPVLGVSYNKRSWVVGEEVNVPNEMNKDNISPIELFGMKQNKISSNLHGCVINPSVETPLEDWIENVPFNSQKNGECSSPILSFKIPKKDSKCTVINEDSGSLPVSAESVLALSLKNKTDQLNFKCKATAHVEPKFQIPSSNKFIHKNQDSIFFSPNETISTSNKKHICSSRVNVHDLESCNKNLSKSYQNKIIHKHLSEINSLLLDTAPDKNHLPITTSPSQMVLINKNKKNTLKLSYIKSSELNLSPVLELGMKMSSINEDKKFSTDPMFSTEVRQKLQNNNLERFNDMSVLNIDVLDKKNCVVEEIESTPCVDSEFDIRQFPIFFSHVEQLLSPLPLSADANLFYSSQVKSEHKHEVHSHILRNAYKEKSNKKNSRIIDVLIPQEAEEAIPEMIKKPPKEKCFAEKPSLHFSSKSVEKCTKSLKPISVEIHNANSHKKTVKKKLSFEDQTTNGVTSNRKIDRKNKTSDEEIILSGVEQLYGAPHDCLKIEKKNQIDFSNLREINQLTTETKYKKSLCKVQNDLLLWKNQEKTFETDSDVVIEEFGDESSCEENDFRDSVNSKKIELIRKDLNRDFDQGVKLVEKGNSVYHSGLSFHKVTSCEDERSEIFDHDIDIQEALSQENAIVTSEASNCEEEIQEILSQESIQSPDLKIECSTSPNTKSSEETQTEKDSGTLSFPPPLEVVATRSCNETVLDSACKSKRTRVKRGSLVERLQRLVRAEKASVNMFHHEGGSHSAVRACSLHVDYVTKACSRLFIIGHYTDKHQSFSEEFSLGEEDVDPEVWLFVDPVYVKNVMPGSTILVYPPWQSLWQDGRGIMLMFGATKIQQISSTRPAFPPSCLNVAATLERQFSCHSHHDQCGCLGELMGQLFGLDQPTVRQEQMGNYCWVDGSVMAALAGGRYPHSIQLRVTVLHLFHTRSLSKRTVPSLLCLDGNGHVCQINLRSMDDESKLELVLRESNTITFSQVTICKRVNIDRCRGLRSMLRQLHNESANQLLLYVATLLSDQWSVRPFSADPTVSTQLHPLLDISLVSDGRARARVCVMALRADQLYVWDKQKDSYYRINILSSAVVPSFPARAVLNIEYLWVHQDELMIDKFSTITLVENATQDSPIAIPLLSLESTENDLVLLDNTKLQKKKLGYFIQMS
ncbi:uncharacterized protein LOC124369459 isoform X2 [Homalodisca vitripennis]|uniref:uncharacterized protein LOC124369459 isoform X2 n=1 Tax=Homalodisca vitripennis TaxID=197043 RepID=UPI001EEA0151|nr:uncharacterized protein LOC124369459 isoform X2 [Homalodisca vitripennis]